MTEAPATATRPRSPVHAALFHLTSVLVRERGEGGLPPGDRAELRRMDPLGVLPHALWRLLTATDVKAVVKASEERDRQAAEQAVAVMVQAMAEAGGPRGARIGHALAGDDPQRKDYAEDRFVRLLRARGLADVAFCVRQAAQWCAAKNRPVRFDDDRGPNGFGPFVLAAALQREEDAARRAHAIARDYFTPFRDAAPLPSDPEG